MFTKTYLSPSIFNENEWMHVCMIMLHKQWKHGEVKSTMLESMVNTSFGKDYGFICTCNKGSTKFPKSTTTSKYYRVTRLLLIQ